MNSAFPQPQAHLHFVGIKGVAMTAFAVWAKQAGYTISGSDTSEVFLTDMVLAKHSIMPSVGFDTAHVEGADAVIYTGAHGGSTNIEVKAAIEKSIPVLSHGEALGEIMRGKTQIGIAGCHGKTTTASLVAFLLSKSGIDTSYAIGAPAIAELGDAGHFGTTHYFVAEADEYATDPQTNPKPRFLWLEPSKLIITNIDYDHPDMYPDLSSIKAAYEQLVKRVSSDGLLVLNYDDEHSQALIRELESQGKHVITVGWKEGATYRIIDNQGIALYENSTMVLPITLSLVGKHNVLNAAMAAVLVHDCGVTWDGIAQLLPSFRGAGRRFERIPSRSPHLFIDDYAHHPTEITATIAAARQAYQQRPIVVVFQPHTMSRTRALHSEFVQALALPDITIIAPLYASAREGKPTLEDEEYIASLLRRNKKGVVAKSWEECKKVLSEVLTVEPSVVLFMGAGDIGTLGRQWVQQNGT